LIDRSFVQDPSAGANIAPEDSLARFREGKDWGGRRRERTKEGKERAEEGKGREKKRRNGKGKEGKRCEWIAGKGRENFGSITAPSPTTNLG